MEEQEQFIRDFLTKSGKDFTDQTIADIQSFYGDDHDRLISDMLTRADKDFTDQTVKDIKSYYKLGERAPREEPAPVDEEPERVGLLGFAKDVFNEIKAGSAQLGAWLARTPAYLLDLSIAPQNLLADNVEGFEFLKAPNSKELAERGVIPQNKIAEYYDNQVKAIEQNFNEELDKNVTEYLTGEDKDLGKFIRALTRQLARSFPITLGIMAASASGAGMPAITAGGAAVFGAGEAEELKQQGVDPDIANLVGLGKGTAEGVGESIGLAKLGPIWRDIFFRQGKEAADNAIKGVVKDSYGKVFKRYGLVTAEETLGEGTTQLLQNMFDKYSGVNPDLNIMEGVPDALLVGAAGGAFYSGPTALTEMAMTKRNRNRILTLEEIQAQKDAELSNPDIPNKVKDSLLKERNKVADELNERLSEDKAKFDALTEDQQQRALELRDELSQIEATLAAEIPVTDKSKETLEGERDKVQQQLDNLLAKAQVVKGAPIEPIEPTEDIGIAEDEITEGFTFVRNNKDVEIAPVQKDDPADKVRIREVGSTGKGNLVNKANLLDRINDPANEDIFVKPLDQQITDLETEVNRLTAQKERQATLLPLVKDADLKKTNTIPFEYFDTETNQTVTENISPRQSQNLIKSDYNRLQKLIKCL